MKDKKRIFPSIGRIAAEVETKVSKAKSYLDPNKINAQAKAFKSTLNAKVKHFVSTAQNINVKLKAKESLSQVTKRAKVWRESAEALKINKEVLVKNTKDLQRLLEGTKAAQAMTRFFTKRPWSKNLLIGGAIALGVSLLNKMVTTHDPQPVIPRDFDKGYDNIQETLTDFGSPVHLQKTASKTITPYYSTVRKATYTTVQSTINNNISLLSSKHAIQHTRY